MEIDIKEILAELGRLHMVVEAQSRSIQELSRQLADASRKIEAPKPPNRSEGKEIA